MNSKLRAIAPILAVLLAVATVPIPGAWALTDYLEDFEDDPLAGTPTASFYAFSATGSGTKAVSNNPALGARAYKATGGTQSKFNFGSAIGYEACDAPSTSRVSFAFQMVTLGTASTSFTFRDSGSGADKVQLIIDPDGTMDLSVEGNSGATAAGLVTTISTGQWYNASLFPRNCGLAVGSVFMEDQGEIVDADAAGAITTLNELRIDVGTAAIVGFDNLGLLSAPTSGTAVGAIATVAVTALTGFDVDDTGSSAVARTNAGANVRSYDAHSLGTQVSAASTPNCAISHGVMAVRTHVAYLDCDGAGDREVLRIRNSDDIATGSPTTYPNCPTCPKDIGITSGFQLGHPCSLDDFSEFEGQGEISEIAPFSIDFRRSVEDTFFGVSNDRAYLSWAFSTATGYYGVAAFEHIETETDCRFDDINFYGTGSVAQICSFQHPDNEVYVGAVKPSRPTELARVDYTIGEDQFDADLQPPAWTNSALGGAEAIECEKDKAVVLVPSGGTGFGFVYVIDSKLGNVLQTITLGAAGGPRSVAMDASANVIAYREGSKVHAYNITTQTVVCSMDVPAGTFFDVELDNGAQSLWIATDSLIARYALAQAGCVPITATPTDPTAPPPAGDGLTGLSGVASGVASFFGVTFIAGQHILGFLFLVVAAVLGFLIFGGAKERKKNDPIPQRAYFGAAAFAGVMFFVNGFIGLFHVAMIFGGFVVGGLLTFFAVRGR